MARPFDQPNQELIMHCAVTLIHTDIYSKVVLGNVSGILIGGLMGMPGYDSLHLPEQRASGDDEVESFIR